MSKRGFTLIELLVVIGIIALLTAIAALSMAAAKNRAYSIRCLSNLRQLSLGFTIYQQENKTFPYGFSDAQLGEVVPEDGYAGNGADKQGWWWFNFLQSAIEFDLHPDSIAWCPAGKRTPQIARENILCGNYGVNRSICKDAQGTNYPFSGVPLRSGQVRTPSATLLLSDSGYSLLSWLAAAETNETVFENPNRISSFYIPGLTLNQTRPELQANSDAIKGRHPHQTLNIGFADGHNEVRPAESLRIEQTISNEAQLPSLWRP